MPKIIMTMLVKNELDIIEHNIRFHANNGIDGFYIMDNGSEDGTLEKIHELKCNFDITIVKNPQSNYQQAKWMTLLAKLAKKNMGADFVISNDADEFWVPAKNFSYKKLLKQTDSVITVTRYNMLFTTKIIEDNYHYSQSNHYVSKSINYSIDDQLYDENICMQFVPISPKVIVNPKGLIKIKGGNHRAKHWRFFHNRTEPKILIYHFPIRSYQRFLKNIENRVQLLAKNARMGPHYKRWVSLYRNKKLEQEFERMAVNEAEMDNLKKLGLIKKIPDYEYKQIHKDYF